MSINLNNSQPVGPVSAVSTVQGSAGAVASTAALHVTRGAESDKRRPAASIELSASAEAVQSSSNLVDGAAAQMEAELIKEIKGRLAAGTFEIDYQKIAGNMLRDALAQAQSPRKGPTES